ncbi:MAG: sporulation protein [Bacteroidetes bacterium HGW-Bacteroidetes-4]|jgi:hypothetical protein|nr:MAG: sporulation protein [Bacteroidetes bacterium HGW-Bacteroidetes-4]
MWYKLVLTGSFLFMAGSMVIAQETNKPEELSHDIFSVLQDNSQGGKIQLFQDPELHVLVDRNIRINKKQGVEGYRIQLFSSSGQDARDKANQMQQRFIELYPDFNYNQVYTEYAAPYFKLRVGDFRNKNEAYELYHSVRKKFPSSYIVKTRINYPKLEAESL